MTDSVLIIDSDQRSNEHLRGLLHPRYEVLIAPVMEEGWHILNHKKIDLVIGDYGIFKSSDKNVPQAIRRMRPESKIALISSFDAERYLSSLSEWKCYHVLPRLPFYNARDVHIFVANILEPENAFGLPRYLSEDAEWDKVKIIGREQKNSVLEEIINYFALCEYEIHELYDVRLIMEESINNALFHAFRDEHGHEKYQTDLFETLEPDEEVIVEYGSDATNIGFSVTDNRGTLTPSMVVEKMARQYYKEGLFDESGRGLYLARMLSGNMVINIVKNVKTQILCIFYEKRLNIPKPFSINYME